jgi:hypothetical protein
MENGQPKSEELRFAYDQLRKEILLNDDLTLKILAGTLTLTGVLMGFASSNAVRSDFMKGILFFVAAAIALIGSHQIVDRDRATFIVGHYLRLFLEPDMPYMQWETILKILRRKIGHGNFFIYHMMICISLVCIAFLLGCFFLFKSINPIDQFVTPAAKQRLVYFICISVGVAIALFVIRAWLGYIRQKRDIPEWWIKIKTDQY